MTSVPHPGDMVDRLFQTLGIELTGGTHQARRACLDHNRSPGIDGLAAD